ncbi:digestive cysteine proteinase 1 [Hydra vulgaris]|uniref:Digestive cysteine proteinase 1 n=1 Tax=Hydra vulgaris TaxID=6087 RepID=A0ABM4D8U1_HYDVU
MCEQTMLNAVIKFFKMMLLSFQLALCISLLGLCSGHRYLKFERKSPTPQKPEWPSRYRVDGILSLPYAELNEPFVGWFDAEAKKSRIDYYEGISKTIQRGDKGEFGAHFLVAPMSNEVQLNQINCFELSGTSEEPALPQSLLPDMENFTYTGEKAFMDFKVDIWQYKYGDDNKYNVYTLYVKKDSSIPVYYEMIGYDSLLGSHYDEYKIRYFHLNTDYLDDVFDEPTKGMECHGFPGPGYEAQIVSNPMREFIFPEDQSHLPSMYKEFIKKYEKEHEESRKHTFKHNLRYINSMNRKKLTFKLKVNHLADHSPDELRKLRGRRTSKKSEKNVSNAKPFIKTMKVSDLPTDINWRLFGAVTPVKDQAVCGSCWSFGTTGTIEGALFLKTGRLVRLSEQNLMDCSWGFGNNGCDGGEEFRAFEYIMKHGGIATDDSYGNYLGIDGYCHQKSSVIGAKIASYVNVTSGDMDALKMAIVQHGPIAVGIDAAHLAFVFYSHGVYYNPECGNKPENLDHAVLAVGYGVQNGEPYTLVKNSWSTHWGNDGYVLMSQRDNNCGVATDATFVNLA